MVLYLSLRAVARAIQTMSRPGPNSTSENRRVRCAVLTLATTVVSGLHYVLTFTRRAWVQPVRSS